MRSVFQVFRAIAAALGLVFACAIAAMAAERAEVEAFLKVTGFDVAIDSIALSAEGAPSMLGLEEGEFGADWRLVAKQVFDPEIMKGRAVDILEQTLDAELLAHAAAFYASDLGLRLVEAENISHFEDDDMKAKEGERLVSDLVRQGSARLEMLKRMGHAIDPNDIGPQALIEIQVRFIMAASFAGVIDMRVDEDGLRALLAESMPQIRREMAASALANSAYTYRDFTDDEVEAYTIALEHPDMQTVYELMNAVHFEVMMNRFEALAAQLGQLAPQQEL